MGIKAEGKRKAPVFAFSYAEAGKGIKEKGRSRKK